LTYCPDCIVPIWRSERLIDILVTPFGAATRIYPTENCKSSAMVNPIATEVGALVIETEPGVMLLKLSVGAVTSTTVP